MSTTTVKERPILFSGPMIRALLAGRKTQTRRALKPQPEDHLKLREGETVTVEGMVPQKDRDPYASVKFRLHPSGDTEHWGCPYGRIGDRLWVREALHQEFTTQDDDTPNGCVAIYSADGAVVLRDGRPACYEWDRERLPSMFCPRWASRILLELTDVRVERLKKISGDDLAAEGFPPDDSPPHDGTRLTLHGRRMCFAGLWESLNGDGAWDRNPWVWALTFRLLEPSYR